MLTAITKGTLPRIAASAKVDKSKRNCFLCDKPGRVARDAKERKATIQAVQQHAKDPAFLGCVQTVDTDGFTAVRRCVRRQEATLGDFIRSSAQRKCPIARSNRYRELTVDDLNAISTSEIASRGGGHLLLTREADPKLADCIPDPSTAFPALSPSGQAEISRGRVATPSSLSTVALRPLASALPSDPAQTVAVETDFVVLLQDQDFILCAIVSDHPISRQDIKVFSSAQQTCVGVGGKRVDQNNICVLRSRSRR